MQLLNQKIPFKLTDLYYLCTKTTVTKPFKTKYLKVSTCTCYKKYNKNVCKFILWLVSQNQLSRQIQTSNCNFLPYINFTTHWCRERNMNECERLHNNHEHRHINSITFCLSNLVSNGFAYDLNTSELRVKHASTSYFVRSMLHSTTVLNNLYLIKHKPLLDLLFLSQLSP